MKSFRVEAVAQTELEESAGWYESQRDGLGFEFIAEVDRVLVRIAHEGNFAGAPIATVAGGIVRREFVRSRASCTAFPSPLSPSIPRAPGSQWPASRAST